MKITNIIKALYDGFECAVFDKEATSELFKIAKGVKQG